MPTICSEFWLVRTIRRHVHLLDGRSAATAKLPTDTDEQQHGNVGQFARIRASAAGKSVVRWTTAATAVQLPVQRAH